MNYKSCILTVIKNEHLYLDEWIKYHLDFGIDHLFIMEDIDSDSHDEITNKYKDSVTVIKLKDFLNDNLYRIAQNIKEGRKRSSQQLYFRMGLMLIKQKYNYDWCFVIDNDEFLTLEKGKSLNEVLSAYQSYDAFVIQWECYGASGLVFTPDYTDKGVIDTYTQKMAGRVPDRKSSLVKTCYNMNTYKMQNFFNQHRPTRRCNWCDTDCRHWSFEPTLHSIYIRHYITRSLEEYLWKRNIRGQSSRRENGKMNFFFIINSDMADNKEEYINAVTRKINNNGNSTQTNS